MVYVIRLPPLALDVLCPFVKAVQQHYTPMTGAEPAKHWLICNLREAR
jgi:hypothetical protein